MNMKRTIPLFTFAVTVAWAGFSEGEPIRRYVAPTAAGAGDGTSWEDASSNLATAYAEVGANPQGGEVWMKEGAYFIKVDPGIELLPNVRLVGGFAGGETDASQSDPSAHETLIHGVNGTYYWCTNAQNVANSTGVAIVENGKVNMPPVELGAPGDFFCSSSSSWMVSNYGFVKLSGCATNSSIENITFAHLSRYAVKVSTPDADGFAIRNCRFIVCGNAKYNTEPAVFIADSHTVIEGCDFIGNRHALRFASSSRTTTNVVSNSRFLYNTLFEFWERYAPSAGIGSDGTACVVVDACLFDRNVCVANASSYDPSMAISLRSADGATLTVANTTFRCNYGLNGTMGAVQVLSEDGLATFTGCQFAGNTNIVSSAQEGCAACIGINANCDLVARDCYFGRNHIDGGNSAYPLGAVLSTGSILNRDISFVNCTIEDNYTKGDASAAKLGTLAEFRAVNYTLVNCLFDGNDAFAGTTRAPDVVRNASYGGNNNRIGCVNTVFRHSASDYVPFAYSPTYFVANSYLNGLDLSSATPSGTGFLGDILTGLAADPGLRTDYAKTAGGAPARGLAKDSPLRGKARGVWLGNDGFPYCQDDSGNWRRLRHPGNNSDAFLTLSAEEAASLSLDAATAVIPDATGRARFHRPSPGPLDFSEGHTVIYLR